MKRRTNQVQESSLKVLGFRCERKRILDKEPSRVADWSVRLCKKKQICAESVKFSKKLNFDLEGLSLNFGLNADFVE